MPMVRLPQPKGAGSQQPTTRRSDEHRTALRHRVGPKLPRLKTAAPRDGSGARTRRIHARSRQLTTMPSGPVHGARRGRLAPAERPRHGAQPGAHGEPSGTIL